LAYKLIFSFILLVFLSCSEIERDNILDPKNPDSKRDKVILLEAFLNTNNPLDYNQYALDAIEALALDNDINKRLIFLEYHRDTQQYSDPLIVDPVNMEDLYERYIDYDPDRFKGVPDLFLNGAADRVQGASSASNVVSRVKKLATQQLLKYGEYTIEVDFNLNGSTIDGTYRVARLANQSSEEMQLRMIITYNSGATGKQTVSRLPIPLALDKIDSGDYLEDSFEINNVPAGKAEKLILVLTDESGINVLHAIERKIE